jgi:hypothetical protein
MIAEQFRNNRKDYHTLQGRNSFDGLLLFRLSGYRQEISP